MRNVVFCILVLGSGHMVRAEFSIQEKAELQKLLDAGDELRSAVINMAVALDASDEPDRTTILETIEVTVRLLRDHLLRGTGWLIHVRVGILSEENLILDGPRENVVIEGFSDLDRASAKVVDAMARLDLIQNWDTSLQDARTDLESAQMSIDSLDRSLGYLNPLPTTSRGYPRQFGPHGFYDNAQQTLWASINYGLSTGVQTIKAYRDGLTVPSATFFERLMTASSQSHKVWMVSAHVEEEGEMRSFVARFTPSEQLFELEAIRAFYEIALLCRPGTGVASIYHIVNIESMEMFRQAPESAMGRLRSAQDNFSNSWQLIDWWTHWFLQVTQPLDGI